MTTLQPCLAVVPARGGSKGLPDKNVLSLGGLPLLAHSLSCAAMSPEITRTVVSTDSERIAEIARRHGGDTPFVRPAHLAADDSPLMPVLEHAVTEVERIEGRSYSAVLLLDPTSPCRLPSDITAAFELLERHPDADGVIACSRPRFNPLWVGVVPDDAGYLKPAIPSETEFVRRQDVPDFYRVNGALYLWRRDHLATATTALAGRQLLLEIPERRAYSIDDADEFDQLETLIAGGYVNLPWMDRSTS